MLSNIIPPKISLPFLSFIIAILIRIYVGVKLHSSIYLKKRTLKISRNIVRYVKIMYDACTLSFTCLVFNEASCNVILAYVRAAFTICHARLYLL